jgi:hypothetical protein
MKIRKKITVKKEEKNDENVGLKRALSKYIKQHSAQGHSAQWHSAQ